MDSIYASVAGIDVHNKVLWVGYRQLQPNGRVRQEVRSFGTMTGDLLAMADWLAAQGVTHVAMESTGVLWKPVWNLLEGRFTLLLVNPRELKQVPGRKSDVKDCQWIAQLLQCGLLRSSFVPERPQRELRDLTRQRAQLTGEHTRTANRIHKVLQDANIKLSCVAADVLGISGRAMLRALLEGEDDATKLADLAQGRMRAKIPTLQKALQGHVTEHHRFLLRHLLDHLAYLETQIATFTARIEERLRPFLDEASQERLDAIPGINPWTIANVVAEIGNDMSRFPSDNHLSSWSGLSPGNEESAGKRIRSRTTKGNRWLRQALVEAAWGATRKKNSYFAAQYHRLAARRGKKRALLAVGHSLLTVVYHLLKHGTAYQDLGGDFFRRLGPERQKHYLVKRLQQLGFEVKLSSPTQVA
jgi:transposase